MYHVWKFSSRRRVRLEFVKSRPHARTIENVPAAWRTRTAANKWAETHPVELPHGYKVLRCFGPTCDMGDHDPPQLPRP